MTIHDDLFALSQEVRYVAIYRDGELETQSRTGTVGSSAAESDVYEELLVNPTLLTLAKQRGDIDCGGLDYIVIRYGNFYQLVLPRRWGHVSVCLELSSQPTVLADEIIALVASQDGA